MSLDPQIPATPFHLATRKLAFSSCQTLETLTTNVDNSIYDLSSSAPPLQLDSLLPTATWGSHSDECV